jgi:hypothetical protein
VTPAALKRLAVIEREISALRVPRTIDGAPEWLCWVTDSELTTLEEIYRRDERGELGVADRFRAFAIECNAWARMLTPPGEPMTDAECVDEWRRLCKPTGGR